MKAPVYSQNGEEVGQTLLPKEIFEVKLNPDLVHQVIVAQQANRRQNIAHTKTRGEVRGGGKKPWRQKGTGKARVGSIRSPLWRGGGVVFGPRKEKVFAKKIPDKMRKKALFMVLSEKAKNNLLIVLDELKLEKAKTKLMAQLIENWKLKIENFKKRNFLLLLPKSDEPLYLASRNIPEAKVMEARNLNCLDLLSFKYLIMPKESIKTIKEIFLK